MKTKGLILSATLILSIFFIQCQTGSKKDYSKVKIQNELDTASYYLGLYWGKQTYNSYIREVDDEAFMKGFMQSLKQDSTVPADFLISQYLGKYSNKLYEDNMKTEHKGEIEKNAQFLEENKKKDNIVTLSSGLQYIIEKEGTGERPAANDQVKVDYTGTLIDGTKFDSSIDRGEPAVFNVTGVIKGWSEALQLMPVGSKWKLFIPSDLAYGARGQGKIPPYATLIFEVELLDIVSNDSTK